MKPPIEVKTFGCKLNQYDSSLLKARLQAELAPSKSSPPRPVVVFNTCAVTAEAGREIRREAARLKRKNPEAFLAVTGCGAQVETGLYAQSPWVDLVAGNSHKKDLPLILKNALSAEARQGAAKGAPPERRKIFHSNIFKSSAADSGLPSVDEGRTRSFLKIQDGCDSFCTFCVIPFARGKSRSLPIAHLARAARKLASEGAMEIVLTGVHIGDYSDGERDLADLVQALLKETEIPRIRLSSLEPPDLTERLLDCFCSDRLCPHFHLSLQSLSSPVLKAMKRQYSRKGAERALALIAKRFPRAFAGMDLIAGFPSESEESFQETYQALADSPWTKVHVFPYSPRERTYAARMAGLSRREILRRASQIRSLSGFRYEQARQAQLGSIKRVLLFKGDSRKGLSRDYWRISLPPSHKKGERKVLIQGAAQGSDSLTADFL